MDCAEVLKSHFIDRSAALRVGIDVVGRPCVAQRVWPVSMAAPLVVYRHRTQEIDSIKPILTDG